MYIIAILPDPFTDSVNIGNRNGLTEIAQCNDASMLCLEQTRVRPAAIDSTYHCICCSGGYLCGTMLQHFVAYLHSSQGDQVLRMLSS